MFPQSDCAAPDPPTTGKLVDAFNILISLFMFCVHRESSPFFAIGVLVGRTSFSSRIG